MENIKIIEVETPDSKREFVIIDKGNNEFISMPKTDYDELQAKQNEEK